MIRKLKLPATTLALILSQTLSVGVLLAQPDPKVKASKQEVEELLRSARQYELLGYVLAGAGILVVALAIPVALFLERRKKARQAGADGADGATGDNDGRKRPRWVKVGLWGIRSRAEAWGYFWTSLILAAACIGMGFVNVFFFPGGLLVLAATWYYCAIRWVDRHGTWA